MRWAGTEVRSGAFGDPRLDLRLAQMLDALSAHPGAPLAEALGTRAALVGAYRFWENPRVSHRQILASHVAQTVARAAQHPVVLAIQDTTEIDLTGHRATRGLGYLASPKRRGLLLHSLLAVSHQGVPLGLLRQICWSRPPAELGKRHQRRQRPLEEKESRRWLHGLNVAAATLRDHPQVVVVGDRESDLFALFAASRPKNIALLLRVGRLKRRVEHPAKYLDAALEQLPVAGRAQITLPRSGNRAPRVATVQLRWTSLEVHPPRHGPAARPVRLQFLLVEESDAPQDVAAIRWVLVTTLPIASLEDALRYVQWYAYRWRIEQFHFVFKDGCRIEELQLETDDSLRRAIATYGIVAWRVLWLTLQSRQTPDVCCTRVLERDEWEVLQAKFYPRRKALTPPTLRESVRLIAKLGGFQGRKADGEPGTKTLWRGIRRLHDLTAGWRMANLRFRDPKS